MGRSVPPQGIRRLLFLLIFSLLAPSLLPAEELFSKSGLSIHRNDRGDQFTVQLPATVQLKTEPFVLSEPARGVLDLRGIKLGKPGTVPLKENPIAHRLRYSSFGGDARVVFDLHAHPVQFQVAAGGSGTLVMITLGGAPQTPDAGLAPSILPTVAASTPLPTAAVSIALPTVGVSTPLPTVAVSIALPTVAGPTPFRTPELETSEAVVEPSPRAPSTAQLPRAPEFLTLRRGSSAAVRVQPTAQPGEGCSQGLVPLAVDQVRFSLRAGEPPVKNFTVTNHGGVAVRIHTRVRRIDQPGSAKPVVVKTSDLIVSPRSAELPAGAQRTFRLLLTAAPRAEEQAYEVVVGTECGNRSREISEQHVMSVFAVPAGAESRLIWERTAAGVTLKNTGTASTFLQSVQVCEGADCTRIGERQLYAHERWEIPAPASGNIHIVFSQGVQFQTLVIPPETSAP